MDTARWADEIWRRGTSPEPMLSVSAWADRYRVLAGKASSEPGRWRTDRTPYLREVMDALSPGSPYERVVFMAGAQIGKTETGNNWVAFVIHHAPGPMMAVQPTVEGGKRWSKQRLDPLIESPPLAGLVRTPRSRDSGNTVLQKDFRGGTLIIAGANSAVGLRSMPVRYLFLDEVDGYPPDADGEGDPVQLAIQRTVTFGRRKKIFACSTPTITGLSRIESLYLESDQRQFWVPCPECDEFQVLRWSQVQWPEGKPRDAGYLCEHCGAVLPNGAKSRMLPRGEWRSRAAGDGRTAGFHLSGLYSPVGWSSWGDLAEEFIKAKDSPVRLQVFTNTKLAETWAERGDAPDWERLYERREAYPIGVVPANACYLTAGADIQRDRIEVEIVGWGPGRESWSIDYRILWGDTSRPEVWLDLSRLVDETFPREGGGTIGIGRMAVDSGYSTQEVYAFARQRGLRRVMVVKGVTRTSVLVGSASPVDVTIAGRKIGSGVKIFPVGVNLFKRQLYDWLAQSRDEAAVSQPTYCHFPRYEPEFFKQLTAEQLVRRTTRTGYPVTEWVKTRPRNEALDCRVYAMAAAVASGVDRWTDGKWRELAGRELAGRSQTSPTTPSDGVRFAVKGADTTTPAATPPAAIKSRWMSR
ncbi:MAG: phage terminase large subunit family protein [Alphaproteobacteria bacterium]